MSIDFSCAFRSWSLAPDRVGIGVVFSDWLPPDFPWPKGFISLSLLLPVLFLDLSFSLYHHLTLSRSTGSAAQGFCSFADHGRRWSNRRVGHRGPLGVTTLFVARPIRQGTTPTGSLGVGSLGAG